MRWNWALTCALTATVSLGGCELQPRGDDPGGGSLDTLRAVPSTGMPPRAGSGAVFAPTDEAAIEVSEAFWAGPGTAAYELVGTFESEEALRASLDLDLAVGPADERVWRLGEILVTVDFRGPGPSASWTVVGPPEVLEPYVQRLRDPAGGRSPLRELGVLPLEVRYCCEATGDGFSSGATPDR